MKSPQRPFSCPWLTGLVGSGILAQISDCCLYGIHGLATLMSPPASPPPTPSPAPHSGQPVPAALAIHAAVPVIKIVLLIFNIVALVAFVGVFVTKPPDAGATGVQTTPTWTAQPVYTTAPAPPFTPDVTATVKPTRTPRISGRPRADPTPTATATAPAAPDPTATPAPIPTSQPTPPPNNG